MATHQVFTPPPNPLPQGEGELRQTVLVIGATSSLAQAIGRVLAAKGYSLVLAGRDEDEMNLLASDLAARFGAHCHTLLADLLAADFSPEIFIEQAGDFDHVIIATGDMGDGDPSSLPNLDHTIRINYTLPAMIATLAAERLAEKKKGSIVIISSVAGDRGRQSNYAYGSAKAALTTFASGLRNRFCQRGVYVMTVKPGFIDTPMTWGMKSPLIASREYAAEEIVTVMIEGKYYIDDWILGIFELVFTLGITFPSKKKEILYVPYFWRYIMLIIRNIPERIFKRLSL